MPKTLEDIKAELVKEIQDLNSDRTLEDSMRVMGISRAFRDFTDRMVERAVNKLSREDLHYIEVGRAAEAFFGSMRIK